ncbi:hypothetical protein [Buttiauxella sp.]|uniref:hypothetical protein n=1 Tax=Buttiauxella sp. TaxID=1972222 RepID=UPI003C74B46A
MNRSKREKLIDQLIGEAVLSILYDNGPVSTGSLIERLQVMEATEREAQRRNLIADVIADIRNQRLSISRPTLVPAHKEWDKESQNRKDNNVYQLFDDSPDHGSSKKH